MTLAVVALSIRDFRNLARIELEVPVAGMVIVGPNGHGKTNLLEAIHYLHTLRSVRGARDVELVRFGAEAFHVGARMTGASVDVMGIGFARAARRKKVTMDGVECERLADAFGAVPSVMFSPRDVDLVAGAPTERRRFLDIALATTSRRYLTALQRYRAALVRRNASLREAVRRGDGAARAAVWEPALAEAGATLWCERVRWSRWAAPRLEALCAAIGERQRVTLDYHTALGVAFDQAEDEGAVKGELAAALERDRAHDLRRTLTHSGPHRDDLALKMGGRPLRTFGSAGQQRTAAIALRLLERETLRERAGRAPLVLLDDPFAELDVDRARRILGMLGEGPAGQTILVVPRGDDVPAAFTTLARYYIHDGVLEPGVEAAAERAEDGGAEAATGGVVTSEVLTGRVATSGRRDA